jgi:hypothetical protein
MNANEEWYLSTFRPAYGAGDSRRGCAVPTRSGVHLAFSYIGYYPRPQVCLGVCGVIGCAANSWAKDSRSRRGATSPCPNPKRRGERLQPRGVCTHSPFAHGTVDECEERASGASAQTVWEHWTRTDRQLAARPEKPPSFGGVSTGCFGESRHSLTGKEIGRCQTRSISTRVSRSI